jgi:tRNA(Ile)-lysidine synthase
MMIEPPAPEFVTRFERDLARFPSRRPAGQEGASIGIAVSGGPDSLALLLLAAAARPGRIAAVTVDHGLRAEAADEARFVGEICASLSVPHEALRIIVTDDPAGLQAAARDARYAAMAEWAFGSGIPDLATAHHLDDQAETVLMRLERGAGIAGLGGIRASRELASGVRLVRPLLGWRRSELVQIVRTAGLAAINDPSNRDPRFDRAAVRARLAQGWPDPVRLAAVAGHMVQAEEALTFATDRLASERFDEVAGTLAANDLPRELRRRLLVKALIRLANGIVLRGDEVDRLLDRLSTGQVSTLGGLRIAPGPPWRFTPAPPHRSA